MHADLVIPGPLPKKAPIHQAAIGFWLLADERRRETSDLAQSVTTGIPPISNPAKTSVSEGIRLTISATISFKRWGLDSNLYLSKYVSLVLPERRIKVPDS